MGLLEHLDILMILAVITVLLAGYPVAFTLAGVALVFAGVGLATGVFDATFFAAAPSRIFGTMTNQVLVAVPLFVFMGVMLEKSRVAEELLDAVGAALGSVRGGLGVAVVLVGALLAASTGVVGATVVTMGLLSLPTMLKRGYNPSLAAGSIAASGTLGQIIPPSIVLVLLGDVMTNAYQRAQLEQGVFAPETVSVGDLFAGALVPGLLLVALYAGYQLAVAFVRPQDAPGAPPGEAGEIGFGRLMHAIFPPIILIVAVLGSILAGLATPTEAAGVGAVGATFLAGVRRAPKTPAGARAAHATALGALALVLLIGLSTVADTRLGDPTSDAGGLLVRLISYALAGLAVLGGLAAAWSLWGGRVLHEVCEETGRITTMVFVILIGATLFSLVFRGLGGDETVEHLLTGAASGLLNLLAGPLSAVGLVQAGLADNVDAQVAAGVFIVMAVMFVLGFFLDFIEITFVVVPLVAPPLLALGVDPVWLGVMIALNLQTSFLTPPFGFALFYLRGVAPPEVTTAQIYRGAAPFVGIQIAALISVATFPALATALPNWISG